MASSLKKEKEWPDTDPPEGEVYSNCNINGIPYKKSEVSPGRWQWVEDEPAMKRMADRENHKQELWRALTSRVLTDSELKEVASYGRFINITQMVPYNAKEKLLELNNALLIQQMLRGSK